MAESDEKFRALLRRSPIGIGSANFVKKVRKQYQRGASRLKTEDVVFCKPVRVIVPEKIIRVVCRAYKIPLKELACEFCCLTRYRSRSHNLAHERYSR